MASQRSRVRLAWALLASLLLHLVVIGDLASAQWWRSLPQPSAPAPLEVQILPGEAAEALPLPAVRARAVPEPRHSPVEQPAPPQEQEPPAPPPAVDARIVDEPPAVGMDESLATVAEPVPAASTGQQDADRVAQRLPPDGKLVYRFYWGKSRWLAGQAIHQWRLDNGYYSLSSTISTTGLFHLFRPLTLVEIAKGQISGATLRPLQFSTQLNDYPMAVAIFNWEAKRFRWYRDKSSFTQPLAANAYDKISFLYQLYLSPEREKYFSAEITTGRHLEHYDILNLGTEEIEIDDKTYPAMHLRRLVASAEMERIDIWLSTTMNYLPLKMTYANQAGDHFEQLIAYDSLPPH